MGQKIRGFLKPNTLKRSRLRHVEVPNEDKTSWMNIEDKEEVENHLIARNVDQFSHVGATPFGNTQLRKELRHTGDSDMAEITMNGTLDHECMEYEAIRAVVEQLKRYPTM
jgi:hypothetical protein